MKSKFNFILFAVLALASTALYAQSPNYNVTAFFPSSSNVSIENLNNLGEFVGFYYPSGAQGPSQAFLYSNGELKPFLGALAEPGDSGASDINDASQVVGYYTTASGEEHAFLYSGGNITDLGTLEGQTGESAALGINNVGEIIGQSKTKDSLYHAVIFRQDKIIDLNLFGGYEYFDGFAYLINDHGEIGGQVSSPNFFQDAFVYKDKLITDLTKIICPKNGFTLGEISRITNSGQVLGNCQQADNNLLAFIYNIAKETYSILEKEGYMIDATDMNEAGQIVGVAYTTNSTGSFPFLTTDGIQYTNLNDLIPPEYVTYVLQPFKINNQGQIMAGLGMSQGGGAILTPVN